MQKLIQILEEAGVNGLGDMFASMEVAEQVIAERFGSSKDPAVKELTSPLFLAVCPPKSLRGLDPVLYKSHVTELADRFQANHECSFDQPTKAELLVAVSEITQRELNDIISMCAEQLFYEVYGREKAHEVFAREYDIDDYASPDVRAPWHKPAMYRLFQKATILAKESR